MSGEQREIVVTDIKIPFWSMVTLMVKWAVAAIPAVIILLFIAAMVMMVLGLLFGSGWHHWWMWRSTQ